MPEIKTNPAHPSSMEQRIRDRLRNSGDTERADIVTKSGDGARRTYHNIHHAGGKGGHLRARDEEERGESRREERREEREGEERGE